MREIRLGLLLLGAISLPVWGAPYEDFPRQTHVTLPTRLWTEPTKFGEPIAELEPGLELKVLTYSTTGSWLRARTPSDREGWVLVRHTALAGRRDEPLVKGAEGSRNARRPSSLNQEGAGLAAPNLENIWGLHLHYLNQLTRSKASGLSAGFALDHISSSSLSFGVGFDWNYAFESTTSLDPAISARVSRTTHQFLPHLRAQFQSGRFNFLAGLGLIIDRTAFETTDLTTGAVISTAPGGALVTGSQLSYAAGFKLVPGYTFPLTPDSSLVLELQYLLVYDPSDGSGSFAGTTPTGHLAHSLGGGLRYLRWF